MKKAILVATMLITMVLASRASNKTTVAAAIELDQPETLVLEKEEKDIQIVGEGREAPLEEIGKIQAACGETQANLSSYRQSGGKYYADSGSLVKATLFTGSALDRVMMKYGYSTYQVDYYYWNQYGHDVDEGPIYLDIRLDGNRREQYYCCEMGTFQNRAGSWVELEWDDSGWKDFIWALEGEGALILRTYDRTYSSSGGEMVAPTDLGDAQSKFVGCYEIMEDAGDHMMNPEWGGVFDITKIENGKIYGSYSQYSSAISVHGIKLDFSQGVAFEHNRFVAEGVYTRPEMIEDYTDPEFPYRVKEYPCQIECWFEVINGKVILRTWDLNEIGAVNIYYKNRDTQYWQD